VHVGVNCFLIVSQFLQKESVLL